MNHKIDWLIDSKIDCEIDSRLKPHRILDFFLKKNLTIQDFCLDLGQLVFYEN